MNTKHLKAKILDLAIRGKLVPQDTTEGNAADLLQKIREEKVSHGLDFANAKSKKNKQQTEGALAVSNLCDNKNENAFASEIPFEIPENWCWCRLGEICKIITKGSSPSWQNVKYVESGILFITSENVRVERIDLKNKKFLEPKFNTIQSRSILEKGDILTNIVGASIGRSAIFNLDISDANINQAVSVIRLIKKNLNTYIIKLLNSSFVLNQMTSNTVETARANISLDTVYNFLIPLPPLSEQKRIVSAIEKAFEQIDIIEKSKFNLKTYIKQTKSKVLDLAIHGKLVEQNPQEGNAFELLEKIRSEKEELVKQKKLKEDKNASYIIKADDGRHYEQFADGSLKDIEDEIPFDEPSGWTWCRINEIAIDMADGPFGSNLKSEHYTTNKEARIIQLSNLSDEGWREENTRYTTIKYASENISRSIVKAGNIVIAKMMPAGRAMICPDKEQMYVLSSDCVKLVPIDGVDKQFLVRALNSPFFRNRVVDNVQGVTRQRTSISKLRGCLFPLPPLAEQKRIVAKIEQVFEQLNILEKSLGE